MVNNPNNEFGDSEESIIYININESNDLPYLEEISDYEILEDSIGNIAINYSDVDNDLSVSITSSNEVSSAIHACARYQQISPNSRFI